MKKSSLKVSPAKRIYKAKYPSYADKNPLDYPETRPYPFNQKFLKWVLRGSMVGATLLGGVSANAQNAADSLSNPFPLKNANVPYTPVSFGTGQPERVSSENAISAIRKAFLDMGIELQEDAWLGDRVGVYLDGYSEEEKIGFVFLDGRKMDGSFARKRVGMLPPIRDLKIGKEKTKKKLNLDSKIEYFEGHRDSLFELFLKNNGEYVNRLERGGQASQDLLTLTRQLPRADESKQAFEKLYLEYKLAQHRSNTPSKYKLVNVFKEHVEARFEDPILKIILLESTNHFRFSKDASREYKDALVEGYAKNMEVKSNDTFIANYLIMEKFNQFNHSYYLSQDPKYIALKIEIMDSVPISKWLKHFDKLDAYADRARISIAEARKIDQNNFHGVEFIAPIAMLDDLMVVRNNNRGVPDSLYLDRLQLAEEFNNANGMTKEVLAEKRKAYNEINEKYSWQKLKELPKSEKDSLSLIKKLELKQHNEKYKSMEKLSPEEKEVYFKRLRKEDEKIGLWYKENENIAKQQTLKRLEQEVKAYIQWARSQMGG